MQSNSTKMTLEEKLVQHIKDTGLNALIDDEDAIIELTRRAVEAALIQPTRYTGTYGRYEEQDSLAVATAKTIAKEACEKITISILEKLMADSKLRAAILETVVRLMPGMLMATFNQNIMDAISQNTNEAIFKLQEKLRTSTY